MNLIFSLIIASVAFAQSRETPVYLEQFYNLQVSMERAYAEVSQIDTKSTEARLDLSARMFALQKAAHRLQEGSAEAGTAPLKIGKGIDKRLHLVGLGCMGIDSILTALTNYLETDDRIFLSLAVEFRQTVISIRKVL